MNTIGIKQISIFFHIMNLKERVEVLAVCHSPLISHTHTHKPMAGETDLFPLLDTPTTHLPMDGASLSFGPAAPRHCLLFTCFNSRVCKR